MALTGWNLQVRPAGPQRVRPEGHLPRTGMVKSGGRYHKPAVFVISGSGLPQNAAVSPMPQRFPWALRYRFTVPVAVSVTVIVYCTSERAP